jgi:hypothetical protein
MRITCKLGTKALEIAYKASPSAVYNSTHNAVYGGPYLAILEGDGTAVVQSDSVKEISTLLDVFQEAEPNSRGYISEGERKAIEHLKEAARLMDAEPPLPLRAVYLIREAANAVFGCVYDTQAPEDSPVGRANGLLSAASACTHVNTPDVAKIRNYVKLTLNELEGE